MRREVAHLADGARRRASSHPAVQGGWKVQKRTRNLRNEELTRKRKGDLAPPPPRGVKMNDSLDFSEVMEVMSQIQVILPEGGQTMDLSAVVMWFAMGKALTVTRSLFGTPPQGKRQGIKST